MINVILVVSIMIWWRILRSGERRVSNVWVGGWAGAGTMVLWTLVSLSQCQYNGWRHHAGMTHSNTEVGAIYGSHGLPYHDHTLFWKCRPWDPDIKLFFTYVEANAFFKLVSCRNLFHPIDYIKCVAVGQNAAVSRFPLFLILLQQTFHKKKSLFNTDRWEMTPEVLHLVKMENI